MFEPPEPFDIKSYIKDCLDVFGIVPRPHWMTTEFGGHVRFSPPPPPPPLLLLLLPKLLPTAENQNITGLMITKILRT